MLVLELGRLSESVQNPLRGLVQVVESLKRAVTAGETLAVHTGAGGDGLVPACLAWAAHGRARIGAVNKPDRVVAPTKVKGLNSI